MNRLFNAKIELGSWVLLAAVLGVTIYIMWATRNGIAICVMLLLLTVMIERIIHTNYTVTPDGRLIIHTGRFAKDKVVPLATVKSVERVAAMRLFGHSFRSCVVIECMDGRIFSVIPKEEEKFVKYVKRAISEQEE